MAGRPRPRKPLTVTIVFDEDAPKTEADWTPEQKDEAIRALATVIGATLPAPPTQPEKEAA
jgi:hypothetical protein